MSKFCSLSVALDLVSIGKRDGVIDRHLQEGLEFCRFVERGIAPSDSVFSVNSLRAEAYVKGMLTVPGSSDLFGQLPQMSAKLAQVISGDGNSAIVDELRGYFFELVKREHFIPALLDDWTS